MLLNQRKQNTTIMMNQGQETGLSQRAYLERLLREQQQYQQKLQQQFAGDRNGNMNINNGIDINLNNNDTRRSPGSLSFAPGNSGTKSPAMAISNGMSIGMNHHHNQQQQQQNRMISLLQERQQQQHYMANSIVGGPSDISSNLGIPGLSPSVGQNSRVGNAGIGSGVSSSAWMDGFSGGGLAAGTIANAGGSLYPIEQDLLLGSQRYPPLGGGGSLAGNRLKLNGEGNGSFNDAPLTSVLGGLPQFCMPTQTLMSSQGSLNAHQNPNGKNFTDLLLAKQAQAAFLQATQAHLPRTIRLPCGARGMKADHNSSTAYFDVPENARHGQHLLCSHSVCRAAGVKFRYCFYCKKPVTKQNFRSRHLHANLDPKNKKKDEKEEENKVKKPKEKVETKRKMGSETKKSNADGKNSIDGSGVSLKKRMTENDDKDSIEFLSVLPVEGTNNGTEYGVERPSKLQKLTTLEKGDTTKAK